MTTWTETFSGGDAASWPAGWSMAGLPGATATVVSGRGRLTGVDVARTAKARFDRMRPQTDSDVVFTFTPPAGAWYLTVGARTRENGAIFDNFEYSDRGMYVQVSNFFGSNAFFTRWAPGSWFDTVADTPTGMPAWVDGTAYKLRFRVRGYGLYLRVWEASAPEPTTWNLTAVDLKAWTEPGKLTIAYSTNLFGETTSVDVDDVTVTGLDPDPLFDAEGTRHDWSMWSRTPSYALAESLPIISAQGVRKHLGVSRAVLSTPFTEAAWASLQPSCGVVLFRDGWQEFSGLVSALELDWDAEDARVIIKAECLGDEQHLDDRPVFPDPLRAADDQTVSNYWRARDSGGVVAPVVASTAMLQLISDQAGATCRADRRVPGLTLGPDPGSGVTRGWSGRYIAHRSVLGQLEMMSVASGANLGLRMTTQPSALLATIYAPRDLSNSVKFSVEFGNVAGLKYRLEAPTATHGLAGGQGDLKARLHKLAVTTSSFALSWGRQIWRYIDRRDTADTAELTQAATDEVTDGDATVSLATTLLDTDAARYRKDYDLGDKVTVFVRVPGQEGPVATVADVIREIAFTVDSDGSESIRPAIGTFDAKAVIPTPTQKQLLAVRESLSGLIGWK